MIKAKNPTGRTIDQLRFHYEVEKKLATRLREAKREDRRRMYGKVYNELYSQVSDHPLLQRKALSARQLERHQGIQSQLRFLRRFIKPGSIFLEIGAGSCLISMEIAKKVKRVIAVDVSEEITRRDDVPSNLELRIFDGVEVPVQAGTVDIAYSHQVMEHIHPDDAFEQLRSIHRSLVPGGAYVCIVPNRISGPHDISRHFDEVATGFHMKEYTTAELALLLRRSGFRRIRSYAGAKGHYFAIPQWFLIALESLLDTMPFRIRANIGRRIPTRQLLEIRMVGWK
jgi:SAM-dependent methyltransferase